MTLVHVPGRPVGPRAPFFPGGPSLPFSPGNPGRPEQTGGIFIQHGEHDNLQSSVSVSYRQNRLNVSTW